MKSTSYREQGIVSFKRQTDDDEVLVFHNVSKDPVVLKLDDEDKEFKKVYYSNFEKPKLKEKIDLPPYSTLILIRN